MAVRVVFVRSKSPAGIEPRIAKEAASLARAGYDVHAILWDREGAHPRAETRDGIRIHRVSLRAPEGRPSLILRVPAWWIRLVLRILRLRPDVVHAVDFDTVIPAYFAARIRRAPLVYDVFDVYADMVTASIPPWVRGRLASAERRMVSRADAVIVPDLRRSWCSTGG
jgi:glycosyltransferase involved in cell wall biosynthesis